MARKTLAGFQPETTTIRCPWCWIMLSDCTDGLWCDALPAAGLVEPLHGRIIRADHVSGRAYRTARALRCCGSLMRWQTLTERWRCLIAIRPLDRGGCPLWRLVRNRSETVSSARDHDPGLA